jgi:hypothetical protein
MWEEVMALPNGRGTYDDGLRTIIILIGMKDLKCEKKLKHLFFSLPFSIVICCCLLPITSKSSSSKSHFSD